MTQKLPKSTPELMSMSWEDFEPMYLELEKQTIQAGNVETWLSEWSRLSECVNELYSRLYIATTQNTADEETEKRFNAYLDNIYSKSEMHEQKLKEMLLGTRLEPAGFDIPLRNIRSDYKLFREENLPLLTEEQKLGTEFDKIVGAQTVEWEGEEKTVSGLSPYLISPDRNIREKAWKAQMTRIFTDREKYNDLWKKFLPLRMKIAKNAEKRDYREYKWQQYYRFDYSPADCLNFHKAIEQVVVPAVSKLLKRHKELLGVNVLRPWDIDQKAYVDPRGLPPLAPFSSVEEQVQKTQNIFNHVDPVLGGYFQQMNAQGLVDIPNRKFKGPGAYCIGLNYIRKPFVFCNSVGTQEDVSTLIHESGHAFHVFESSHLPYLPQLTVTSEFAEVASMGMELLVSPFLQKSFGGFYTEKEAARALSQQLITSLMFWPYMSVVDSFQHWVYTNPEAAKDTDNCDEEWTTLWDRFMPDQDWSGYEDFKKTGWHRKLHIHQLPFYYVEYGLAQLGAVQVWGNSLKNPVTAIAAYRRALSLGGTVPLPVLFLTAGARLAFDANTLQTNVDLMVSQIEMLDKVI
jgi:oligoendopeptidase F